MLRLDVSLYKTCHFLLFSELGIWVRPRKARALLWNNMDESGRCEPMSIHKANKVEKGRKIILQRWYVSFLSFTLMSAFSKAQQHCHTVTGQATIVISFCLFDLMLYVHGKQLRSCRDDQLLNHTSPGQASRKKLTSM